MISTESRTYYIRFIIDSCGLSRRATRRAIETCRKDCYGRDKSRDERSPLVFLFPFLVIHLNPYSPKKTTSFTINKIRRAITHEVREGREKEGEVEEKEETSETAK